MTDVKLGRRKKAKIDINTILDKLKENYFSQTHIRVPLSRIECNEEIIEDNLTPDDLTPQTLLVRKKEGESKYISIGGKSNLKRNENQPEVTCILLKVLLIIVINLFFPIEWRIINTDR